MQAEKVILLHFWQDDFMLCLCALDIILKTFPSDELTCNLPLDTQSSSVFRRFPSNSSLLIICLDYIAPILFCVPTAFAPSETCAVLPQSLHGANTMLRPAGSPSDEDVWSTTQHSHPTPGVSLGPAVN